MTAQQPSRDDVPEADLLEQQAPVEPPSAPDTEAEADSADTPPAPADEADEADQLEQHEVVSGDEDDYPHEA